MEHGTDGTDDRLTVSLGPLDDRAGFYVADDGVGIPEGMRDRLFETGVTGSDDGTGFGLAIVREIAESHGWEAAATNGEDGGARFEFTGVALD
nr:sensor histidine kinase [Halosegnis sp. DT85]